MICTCVWFYQRNEYYFTHCVLPDYFLLNLGLLLRFRQNNHYIRLLCDTSHLFDMMLAPIENYVDKQAIYSILRGRVNFLNSLLFSTFEFCDCEFLEVNYADVFYFIYINYHSIRKYELLSGIRDNNIY